MMLSSEHFPCGFRQYLISVRENLSTAVLLGKKKKKKKKASLSILSPIFEKLFLCLEKKVKEGS